MGIKHSKISSLLDENNTDLVRPSDWNAQHIAYPPLHQHYFNETPIKLTTRKFTTLNVYTLGTLSVYLNGLREKNIVEISEREFEFTSDLSVDDEVIIDYVKIEE